MADFSNIRRFFQRRYYMPTISVVFAGLMIYAFVQYIRHVEPLDLPQYRKWSEIRQSDTLRVITIPTSYTAFEYRDRWYGYEYELVHQLTDSLGIALKMIEAHSEQEIIDSLYTGGADLTVWPLSQSSEYWYIRPTGPRWEDTQVVATMRKLKPVPANDTLTHYRISIVENSRQWQVFHDDSVRANYDFSHFLIDTIPGGTYTTEELTDVMIKGKAEAVMMRSNVARLMKSYYPTLKISDPLPNSSDQSSWFAITGADTLRRIIDSVMTVINPNPEAPTYSITHKRLYQNSKKNHVYRFNYKVTDGHLSPYDSIFKASALTIGWDWRLLAAIAFIETRFDHTQISTKGPVGLMQLMPSTVRNLGYSLDEVIDPSLNVSVAVKLLDRVQRAIRKKLPEATEQNMICLTIASYNIGFGHVNDAINLAEQLGYNPNIWYDNVELCLRLKADPKYYGLPIVKLGPCNGTFTINYLHEVLATYQSFCKAVPKD